MIRKLLDFFNMVSGGWGKASKMSDKSIGLKSGMVLQLEEFAKLNEKIFGKEVIFTIDDIELINEASRNEKKKTKAQRRRSVSPRKSTPRTKSPKSITSKRVKKAK